MHRTSLPISPASHSSEQNGDYPLLYKNRTPYRAQMATTFSMSGGPGGSCASSQNILSNPEGDTNTSTLAGVCPTTLKACGTRRGR